MPKKKKTTVKRKTFGQAGSYKNKAQTKKDLDLAGYIGKPKPKKKK